MADLYAGLAALARLANGDMTLVATLTHIAEFAVRAVPGADGAGLTVLKDGRADTVVATASFVHDVDAVQYSLGEGPCVTAAAEGRTVRSGALERDPAWTRFGLRASELGVHSALSLPLWESNEVLGVINVYSRAADAFDDRARDLGESYAVPAAVSVRNAQVLAQAVLMATQLEGALSSRAAIDQAIGILMSRSGDSPEQAFTTLTRASQHENTKLKLVAQSVVDEAVRRARARH